MASDPSFAIPARPKRRYPHSGGVEYEGETVFRLRPHPELATDRLASLLEDVFEDEPYRWGDFFDLPLPLYLVRDEQTGDVFRVSVRDGVVRFHVLPETESAGLEALYHRLEARSDADWRVRCETDV